MSEPLYDDRPVDEHWLMEYYAKHVSAMTSEGLDSKADIAAELAWRDYWIDYYKTELRNARKHTPEETEAMRIIKEAAALLKEDHSD